MPDTEPTNLPIIEQEAVFCRHLRSTGMYLDPDRDSWELRDDYDNTVSWCTKSLKNFGPDDEIVGRSECRDPSRSCYEPI